jgi:ATP-dependent RNA circularization protein (DNA/RNA ligase family)
VEEGMKIDLSNINTLEELDAYLKKLIPNANVYNYEMEDEEIYLLMEKIEQKFGKKGTELLKVHVNKF